MPGGLQGARLWQGPPPVAQFRKIRSSFLLHALIIGEIGWVFGYILPCKRKSSKINYPKVASLPLNLSSHRREISHGEGLERD
jgi:hypothetical protein